MPDDSIRAHGAPEETIGARLCAIRIERYGPDGVDRVAEFLGIPPQVWRNIEQIGELIGPEQLRTFVLLTGANPLWLMRGQGAKYRPGSGPRGKPPEA